MSININKYDYGANLNSHFSRPINAPVFKGLPEKICNDVFIKNPAKLCQDVFEGSKLRPDVSKKLLGLVEEFKYMVKFPVKPEDIFIVGSMSSYKYSPSSDIDLKLKLDYSKIKEINSKVLLEDYLRKASDMFNLTHYRKINGHPVEIGAHDLSKQHTSGVYSIIQNKWLKAPNEFAPQTPIDKIPELALYKQFKSKLVEYFNERNKIKISQTLKELSQIRNDALKTKGEMATENWVYKLLRGDSDKPIQNALKIMLGLDD